MAIDDVFDTIRDKIYHELGDIRSTDTAISPLIWYIKTGRAPFEFERRLKACTSRQLSTIAKRLIKHNRGDYNDAINSIYQYIGLRRYP